MPTESRSCRDTSQAVRGKSGKSCSSTMFRNPCSDTIARDGLRNGHARRLRQGLNALLEPRSYRSTP